MIHDSQRRHYSTNRPRHLLDESSCPRQTRRNQAWLCNACRVISSSFSDEREDAALHSQEMDVDVDVVSNDFKMQTAPHLALGSSRSSPVSHSLQAKSREALQPSSRREDLHSAITTTRQRILRTGSASQSQICYQENWEGSAVQWLMSLLVLRLALRLVRCVLECWRKACPCVLARKEARFPSEWEIVLQKVAHRSGATVSGPCSTRKVATLRLFARTVRTCANRTTGTCGYADCQLGMTPVSQQN